MTAAEATDPHAPMTVNSNVAAIERAIAALFPPFVECAALPISSQCTTPFPEELDALAGAVPSRRREFECGRACAHAAIRALRAEDSAIPTGTRRAPVWPAGIVGAISHTHTIATAVASRSTEAVGMGIDIECADATIDDRVRRLVLTPDEVRHVADLSSIAQRTAVLMFSAKECVYKAIAPLWGVMLNHQDVSLRIETEEHGFVASIRAAADGAGTAAVSKGPWTLRGSFAFVDDHVVTGICIDRRARGAIGPAQ